jgi:gamma-glutamyltranspeptidase/glutathione hydrolase
MTSDTTRARATPSVSRSRQSIHKSAASGRTVAVACARAASSEAALEMMQAGGNAIDAAIAAALVGGVIEPMETCLAGSGFLLMHRPGDARPTAVDFGSCAPRAARADMFRIDTSRSIDRGLGVSVVVDDANMLGARASGVPGTIRGLTDALAAFGRLPLSKVLQPAIRAAHDGFEVDNYFTLDTLANLDALRRFESSTRVFLRNTLPPVPAFLGAASLGVRERIRQPELGRSLEMIAAQGADAFYRGELAKGLLATHVEQGGILTEQDLAQYASHIAPARHLRFRDTDVWMPNAPCGALTQIQMLQLWQALYPDGAPAQDSPERTRLLAEATWHAFADRYHFLGDPQHVPVPEEALASEAYAREIAQRIRAGERIASWLKLPQAPWDHFAGQALHDPWAFERTPERAVRWQPQGGTEPTAGTTHVSVIDGEGMAVAITHTAANHYGSRLVCPRTGFLIDAAMGWFNAVPGAANSIAPGKRPLANMAPMLLTRQGEARAALGAPGGRRIISAIAQIAINLVERGHDAEAAVHAPRQDASGAQLLLSERLQDQAEGLAPVGDRLRWVDEQHEGFGYELARPNIVVRQDDGRLQSACDPFVKGFALALD